MRDPILIFEVMEITKSEALVSNGFINLVVDCKATLDIEESVQLASSEVVDVKEVSFEVRQQATLIVYSGDCTIASVSNSVTLPIVLNESLVKDIAYAIEMHVKELDDRRIAAIFGDE